MSLFTALLGVVRNGSVPNYFVSPTGSDTADGRTSATPWQTIAKVNASTFLPGDCIAFQGGQSFAGVLTVPSSGSVVASIAFTSYGLGRATITQATANGDGIDIFNKSYIIIDGINCTGPNTGNAIYCSASTASQNNLIIRNCILSSFGVGLAVGGDAGMFGWNTVTVSNVESKLNSGNGALAYGSTLNARVNSHITFSDCSFHDNGGSGAAIGGTLNSYVKDGNGNCTYSETGFLRCVAFNNGAVVNAQVGLWCYESSGIRIAFCESYNNTSPTTADGDGFDLDGGSTDCTLENCYAHGNKGAGIILDSYTNLLTDNLTVRFCIFENNVNSGTNSGELMLYVTTGTVLPTNLKVYNNVFFNNRAGVSLIQCYNAGITGRISNNIFYSSASSLLATVVGNPTSLFFTGSDWFADTAFSITWNSITYTSFAAWQTATGQEKISGTNVGFNVDPKLFAPGSGGTVGGYNASSLAAYNLQVGSPMIGAGIALSQFNITQPATDYYGNVVTGNGPVGAYSGAGLSVSPAWLPLNDPGLIEWFDPTNTANITLNGSKISSWTGRAKTKTAVQATGANQPTYTGAAINGVQVLSFTGTPVNMGVPAFKHPAAWTMVAVGKVNSTAGTQNFVNADKSNATAIRQAWLLYNGSGSLGCLTFNTAVANFSSGTGLTTNASVIGSQRLATTVMASVNGTDSTPTTTTGTPATLTVAMNFGSDCSTVPLNYLTGLLGDVIYSTTLTTSIKQKMEGYLAWKYGLQANLPVGHPYSSRAPLLNDL